MSNNDEVVNIGDLIQDPRNANQGTERGQLAVNNSFRESGAGRSVLLANDGTIIGGNKSTKAAIAAGISDVRIIRTDGTQLVAVMRTDIEAGSDEARMLGVADNRTAELGLEWNSDELGAMLEDGIDLGGLFDDFELEDLGIDLDSFGGGDDFDEGDDEPEPIEETPAIDNVPDTIWPTDNEWGIPLLDITKQANAYDLPIEGWGAKARGTVAGTLHFYTEDYRFNNLWARPDKVLLSGASNIVECNFSVYDQAPAAVALWATYRKRWLSRYWQSKGIRIFVDLNVARPYDDINLMGVPKGWASYATRGYAKRLDMTSQELDIARTHADSDGVLFLVYGGNDKVRQWCNDNGAVWVAEDMDRAKGKYLGELGSAQ